jgi:hypothetical protein
VSVPTAEVRFHVDPNEAWFERHVGRPDDGTDEWYAAAADALQAALEQDALALPASCAEVSVA